MQSRFTKEFTGMTDSCFSKWPESSDFILSPPASWLHSTLEKDSLWNCLNATFLYS